MSLHINELLLPSLEDNTITCYLLISVFERIIRIPFSTFLIQTRSLFQYFILWELMALYNLSVVYNSIFTFHNTSHFQQK